MAYEHRQPRDYLFGTLTTAVALSDTALTSSAFAGLPTTYSGSAYLPLILHDPSTGVYEVVWVTAHANGSSVVTAARGREGTTARSWPAGTQVVCAPTIRDGGLFWVTTRSALPTDPHIGMRVEIADESVTVERVASGWVQMGDAPVAALRQTALQTIATTTWTVLNFQVADVDNRTGWASGLPSRYTAKADGVYALAGGNAWAANATGNRALRWAKNGAVLPGSVGPTVDGATSSVVIARPMFVRLIIGDYIEMQAYQSSGANLNTNVGTTENQSTMTVRWVGA